MNSTERPSSLLTSHHQVPEKFMSLHVFALGQDQEFNIVVFPAQPTDSNFGGAMETTLGAHERPHDAH